MWLSSIRKRLQPDRFRALAADPATKRLRVIGALCAGLIALDLLVYAFAVAPAVERLAKSRRQYADTKREHAEAVAEAALPFLDNIQRERFIKETGRDLWSAPRKPPQD